MPSAIITGGTSGLGRQIIRAAEDWSFYNLSVLDPDDPAELYNERRIDCDVRDITASMSIRQLVQNRQVINAVINCAGYNRLSYLENLDPLEWNNMMDVNAGGIFGVVQMFLKQLKENRGLIINVLSSAADQPMTASLAYNASKAAAHMMTRQMAHELTPLYGITVIGVSPVKMSGTRMSDYVDATVPKLRGWTEDEVQRRKRSATLTGQEVPPEAVAELIAFLMSNPQVHRHMSGSVIPFGA